MVDVKNTVSKEEWDVRVDLAAFYRTIPYFGWDDLIFTHISARVPGTEDHFLINPYGYLFDEITASNLVKVDLNGKIISETNNFVNPAGFIIHSAIHAARSDAHCALRAPSLSVPEGPSLLLPLFKFSKMDTSSSGRRAGHGTRSNPRAADGGPLRQHSSARTTLAKRA